MRREALFVTMISGLAAAAPRAGAQTRAAARDSLYLAAQEMVVNGDATTGRRLVDSLLSATSPDSLQYAEALYWHATLAATASTAEQDYRRIIVDYPMSPRVDDALLRMGQLELTRGEYDAALQHLQRISAEHPKSSLRAKASYWIARAFFETNDLVHACAANADASSLVDASDVELKNQIDFQHQQCRTVATTAQTERPAAESTATRDTVRDTVTAGAPAPPVREGAGGVSPMRGKKAKPIRKPVTGKVAALKTTKNADKAEQSVDSQSVPEPRTADSAEPATPTPAAKPVVKFTVQVAAYYDRSQAEALAAKLRARGYAARVEGVKGPPFRVRVGTYPSHAAAVATLAKLKAKKITGFVAEE